MITSTHLFTIIDNLGGDDLPTSKFTEYELLDGTMRTMLLSFKNAALLTVSHSGTRISVSNVIHVPLFAHTQQFAQS